MDAPFRAESCSFAHVAAHNSPKTTVALKYTLYIKMLSTLPFNMLVHGQISQFSKYGDWISYIEQLEFYFVANEVTNNVKKRTILLSSCVPETYGLLRSLVSPGKPSDKYFEDLVKILKNHFNPKPSATLQRYKFNTTVQKSGKNVHDYVPELKSISQYCEFNDQLENMLRDRLVIGLKDEHTKKRLRELCQTKTLNYAQALATAVGIESATSNYQEITSGAMEANLSSASVNQIKKQHKSTHRGRVQQNVN